MHCKVFLNETKKQIEEALEIWLQEQPREICFFSQVVKFEGSYPSYQYVCTTILWKETRSLHG